MSDSKKTHMKAGQKPTGSMTTGMSRRAVLAGGAALTASLFAPKGLPPAVAKRLEDVFTQVIQSADFKAMLKKNYLPYDFRDSKALNKDLKAESDWYRDYFQKAGVLKN